MSKNIYGSDKLSYASVKYSVSEQMLTASLTPNSLNEPLDQETLFQILESSGFASHHLSDETIHSLVTQSDNNHEGVIPLEKHTDATFEVKIDKEQMTASLIIKNACCGEDLDYNNVLEALLDEYLLHKDYLNTKLLQKCLSSNSEKQTIIAEGIAPVNGEPSKFEVLFNPEEISKPKRSADGTINHYETHNYITVDENHGVMRRVPHTQGTSGYNILGEEIPSENGEMIKFTMDDSVKMDELDLNLLVAAKKGHPLALEFGVHIDDTLTVKNASLRTGNIHFDGSVQVTGEVLPNVVIEASGDIFVEGMVENATLISGNNISIGGGVISSKIFEQENADDFSPECSIKAQGTITANYCNSIYATAKNNILIENYSMHSQLHSEKHIIFGDNNGKGVLIGGSSYGQLGITANIIGSDAYVRTDIEAGSIASLQKKYNSLHNDITRSKSELLLLKNVLNKIMTTGTPATVGSIALKKAKKFHNEIKHMNEYILKLETANLPIIQRLALSKEAIVNIQKKLYSNVQITINDINTMNNLDRSVTVINCEDYELHFK